jgi:hypothetical protein
MSNDKKRGAQLLTELKSLIDGMPAAKREQILAAVRSVFEEVASECEERPRAAECGGAWG